MAEAGTRRFQILQTNDPFKFWALEFLLDLLEKGESLSAAAERFDLSVSGASQMLDKLRVHFNDPLFVVVSGRLQPTDFAINLGDRLRPIVAEIKSLRAGIPFDPAESTRTFRISSFSIATESLLAELVKRLEIEAPHVRLVFRGEYPKLGQALLNRDLDFAFMPSGTIPDGLHSIPLFELKRVILCRADHPSLSELRETPEHWPQILKKHPTVSVSRFEERDFPSMDSGLLAESIQDSAMLRVYSIATALGVLKETDALAICGFTGAQYLIKLVPWLSCVQIPPSETDNPWLSLVWSQAIHDDPSAVWFRGLIKDWAKNISKDS